MRSIIVHDFKINASKIIVNDGVNIIFDWAETNRHGYWLETDDELFDRCVNQSY